MRKLKKWNWEVFWFVLLIAFIGLLSNETVPDIQTAFIFLMIFGTPFALLLAIVFRKE